MTLHEAYKMVVALRKDAERIELMLDEHGLREAASHVYGARLRLSEGVHYLAEQIDTRMPNEGTAGGESNG